jgi:hypothetical protein
MKDNIKAGTLKKPHMNPVKRINKLPTNHKFQL